MKSQIALELAIAELSSPNATKWLLKSGDRMLAEIVAEGGSVPNDFNGWHWIVDDSGNTLAHFFIKKKVFKSNI